MSVMAFPNPLTSERRASSAMSATRDGANFIIMGQSTTRIVWLGTSAPYAERSISNATLEAMSVHAHGDDRQENGPICSTEEADRGRGVCARHWSRETGGVVSTLSRRGRRSRGRRVLMCRERRRCV